MFVVSKVSGPAEGPTQPPIQCITGALSAEVNRLGLETDNLHLLPRLVVGGTVSLLTRM